MTRRAFLQIAGMAGTLPLPKAVRMTGATYSARAALRNANEGIAETDIAYIDVLIGQKDRAYGVVVAGDRDHPLVAYLDGVREREHKVQITLEELEP